MEDLDPSANKDLFDMNEKHMDSDFNELVSVVDHELASKLILIRQNCQALLQAWREQGSEHWKLPGGTMTI